MLEIWVPDAGSEVGSQLQILITHPALMHQVWGQMCSCLLYTSDAADE